MSWLRDGPITRIAWLLGQWRALPPEGGTGTIRRYELEEVPLPGKGKARRDGVEAEASRLME